MSWKSVFEKRKNKMDYEREIVTIGHFIKYNLYLLSKSIVFNAVLMKEDDINKAVNYAHAVMMAFHDQDHRSDVQAEENDVKK